MIVKEGEGFKTWMSPQFRTFLVGEKNYKARLRVFYCGLYHRLRVHLQLETRHETDSCRYR
ncbi:thiamine biosynthesis lipoprotein ApbE [Klebsiella pneumoniae]|nr:thiamine biosynthesis lipoprotein ApbE [Klebsiella pneumoniae]